ncbi:MAG: DNA polymerase III subunit gamma/tau [Oscillospiraceae bacterium]|nr:DNA polymerase III subunit gamma/tau [Oscillospiraceae bacterium]
MYQALYRKWRPQTFDEVVGQQHITDTLKNQIKNNRLSHAYLFIGTRGTGKTTCARILAKAVNCENPVDGNPCGLCSACQGISEGRVMDVVELDAASNNSVDNVRALRDEAVFSPATVRKRVYIIDEVHMLSTSAFNALLKILEEPPEHLLFILATTELQKVPATILSRCQRHSFKRIDSPMIAEYLEYIAAKENLKLSHDAAGLIARLADGGVRDALSLLDQCSASESIDLEAVYSAMGLAGNRRTLLLMENIISHETAKTLKAFNSLWMDGKDPAVLLTELSNLMRDTLMMQVAPKGGLSLISGGYDSEALISLASRMTREEIMCAMETISKYLSTMKESSNPKVAAELCLVSLCDNTLGESVAELKARISRLEEQLKNGEFVVQTVSAPAVEKTDSEQIEEYYPEPAVRYSQPADDEDELDFAMFQEEQPEDSFLLRDDKLKNGESSTAPTPVPTEVTWADICMRAKSVLTRDVALQLDDSKNIKAQIKENVVSIEITPGFIYGRFNKPEVLNKLAAIASELTGREMRATLSELNEKAREKRSLDDLKAFKEVRFI